MQMAAELGAMGALMANLDIKDVLCLMAQPAGPSSFLGRFSAGSLRSVEWSVLGRSSGSSRIVC